jgi:hypothetical protein
LADRGSRGSSVGWRRDVGRNVGLGLGAPLHGDGLLDEVRVVQLEVAHFLGDLLAYGLGLEVWHQVRDQPALLRRLQVANLFGPNDCRLDGLVNALRENNPLL